MSCIFSNVSHSISRTNCSEIPNRVVNHLKNRIHALFGNASVALDTFRKSPGNADEFSRLFKNAAAMYDVFRNTQRFSTFCSAVSTFGVFCDGVSAFEVPYRAYATGRDIKDICFTKEHRVTRCAVAGESVILSVIRIASEVPLTVFELMSFESMLRFIGFYQVSEKTDGILEKVKISFLNAFFVVDIVGCGAKLAANFAAVRNDDVYQARKRVEREWNGLEEDYNNQVRLAQEQRLDVNDIVRPVRPLYVKPSICLSLMHFVCNPKYWLVPALGILRRITTIAALSLAVFCAAVVSIKIILPFLLVATIIGCTHIATDAVYGELGNKKRYEMLHRPRVVLE